MGGGVENSLSLLKITQLCQEITGNEIAITGVSENRQGDVPIFITDSRRVISATGWQPKRDARQTITDNSENG